MELGNQQGKTQADMELAWLAGFVDADGSFFLGKNNGTAGYVNYIPKLKIVNTHTPTVEHILDVAQRHDLPAYVTWRRKHREHKPTQREFAEILVQGMKRVHRWTQALLPYLVTKREQAELLNEWCELRFAHRRNDPYTEGELAIAARFRGGPENPQRLNAASGRQSRDDTVQPVVKAAGA